MCGIVRVNVGVVCIEVAPFGGIDA